MIDPFEFHEYMDAVTTTEMRAWHAETIYQEQSRRWILPDRTIVDSKEDSESVPLD